MLLGYYQPMHKPTEPQYQPPGPLGCIPEVIDQPEQAKPVQRDRPRSPAIYMSEEIERRFSYHPPQPGQTERYSQIRKEAKALAYTIANLCPESRERSSALTFLDQVVFNANAAIARNES